MKLIKSEGECIMNFLKIVLISTFEPDTSFVSFLKELKEIGVEVLVIDDGSTISFQKTFEEAERLVKVIHHEFSKGKGACIKTGLEYIKANCHTNYCVTTMDYQKKYAIEDVKAVLEEATRNPNAYVLGAKRRTKDTSKIKKLSSEAMRLAYQKKTGKDIYDTQAGLRAFTNNLTDFLLNIKGNHFDYEINCLLKCAEQNIEIKEVALTKEEQILLEKKEIKTPEKEIFTFAMFPCIGIAIDFVLFLILFLFSKQAILSNIFARIISSFINFSRDKKQIYKEEASTSKVAKYYFLFVGGILLANTLIIAFLTSVFNLPVIFAKIITEIAIYAMCFSIKENWPAKETKEGQA